MASALSESETYDAEIIGPDGSDPRTANAVRVAGQGLANRTKFLKKRFDATEAYFGAVGTAGRTCVQLMAGVAPSAGWDWDEDVTHGVIQKCVTAGTILRIPFVVPAGVVLTEVHTYVKAKAGHPNLPANMPTAQVKRMSITGAVVNIGSPGTDGSITTGAYETVHAITMTGLTEVVAASSRYFVDLTAESGVDLDHTGMVHIITRPFYTTP